MNQNRSKLSPGYLLRRGPAALHSRLSNLYRPSYVRLGKMVFRTRRKRRRINIGGGKWYKPRWENIDFFADHPFTDYRIDLRLQQPLPFEDECAELVFSSHCFEHISDDAAIFTLEECSRILKRGGWSDSLFLIWTRLLRLTMVAIVYSSRRAASPVGDQRSKIYW